MNIIRFGLGLRFEVMAGEEGQITPGQLWEEIFSVLTTDDAKGIILYGGTEQPAEGSTSEPCYICAFTNGHLKQMRQIYRKLEGGRGHQYVIWRQRVRTCKATSCCVWRG